MASDQARDLARLANEQAFDLVGIDGGIRLYKLQQTIEKLAALASPPAATTSTETPVSTPGARGEADEIAKLKAQVEELQAEVDDLNVNDDRDVWPGWAEAILKTVREHSGYDGYDDQDGIDLPAEVAECLAELAAQADRARSALAASQAPAVPAAQEKNHE